MALQNSPEFHNERVQSPDPIFSLQLSTLQLQRSERFKSRIYCRPSAKEIKALHILLNLVDWRQHLQTNCMGLTPMLEGMKLRRCRSRLTIISGGRGTGEHLQPNAY